MTGTIGRKQRTCVVSQLKVALGTSRRHPAITSVDEDMPLLVQALRDAGADTDAVLWDDHDVDWTGYDLVVLRSTWDYSLRHHEFFQWVDRCSEVTTLLNPPPVLRWNAYKDSYLAALAANDIPVVSTVVIAPGQPVKIPDLPEFVVKPNVGGGSRGAGRYTGHEMDDAVEYVARIHSGGLSAMIQPYLNVLDDHGERALVFIKGDFVHAIRKNAVLGPTARGHDLREAHPGVQLYSPSEAELGLARRALAIAPTSDPLLYARVDLVSVEGNDPMVMELELVEPNLFLRFDLTSMPTLVNAIVKEAELAAVLH